MKRIWQRILDSWPLMLKTTHRDAMSEQRARLEVRIRQQTDRADYYLHRFREAAAVITFPKNLLRFKPNVVIEAIDRHTVRCMSVWIQPGVVGLQLSVKEMEISDAAKAAMAIEEAAWSYVESQVRKDLRECCSRLAHEVMR